MSTVEWPPAGTLVRYHGDVSDGQVNWGANDDPRGLLDIGKTYTLLRKEVHSWHTKYVLAEYPDKKFNSVHFDHI